MHVNIDLGNLTPVGDDDPLRIVPGLRIPLEKKKRELFVAKQFLCQLAERENATLNDIQINDTDPPDVVFDWNETRFGLEITELLPRKRRDKDAVIRLFRKHFEDRSAQHPMRGDRIIRIRFVNDHAEKLTLPRGLSGLVTEIEGRINDESLPLSIKIPSECCRVIHSICIEGVQLCDHPNRIAGSGPILLFPADDTALIPEDDIPKIVKLTVDSKLIQDVAKNTWLLVFCHHPALAGFENMIAEAFVQRVSAINRPTYSRLFYRSITNERIRTFELPAIPVRVQ